jgi:K+-transporting ATPase KdpF subunit
LPGDWGASMALDVLLVLLVLLVIYLFYAVINPERF